MCCHGTQPSALLRRACPSRPVGPQTSLHLSPRPLGHHCRAVPTWDLARAVPSTQPGPVHSQDAETTRVCPLDAGQ